MRLLQITDSHLFAAADGRLLGLDTRRSFGAVLGLALTAQTPAAALVMTGDLVHDETAEGYIFLAEVLGSTRTPCYCIPGNHDQADLMRRGLGAAAMGPVSSLPLGGWRLIFLDSTRPGDDGGHLAQAQFHQLERLLKRDPAPSLIFLHHHPMPVGSPWMDTMGLDNGPDLLALCDGYPQVKALVCGHIHQEFNARRNHYAILGAPSTCVQFPPGCLDFALDSLAPGYRELWLYPDGRIETWVVRLDGYPAPLGTGAGVY